MPRSVRRNRAPDNQSRPDQCSGTAVRFQHPRWRTSGYNSSRRSDTHGRGAPHEATGNGDRAGAGPGGGRPAAAAGNRGRGRRAGGGGGAELPALAALCRELHAAPELSRQEARTAARIAAELSATGAAVTTGVGGHGVVGVLRNGPGPVVMLRTDLDALPVREETGLPWASAATGRDAEGRAVPVMRSLRPRRAHGGVRGRRAGARGAAGPVRSGTLLLWPSRPRRWARAPAR